MLKGKELGAAIQAAINAKIATGSIRTVADVARHFNVKPPSVYDWFKKGSISKDKLPELFLFFSDVADCDHWGLEKSSPLLPDESTTLKNVARNNIAQYVIHDSLVNDVLDLMSRMTRDGKLLLKERATVLVEQHPANKQASSSQ